MSFHRNLTNALGLGVAALTLATASAHAATKLTVLTGFNGTNGDLASGSLIADAAGNLYGTTWQGGASNAGTVFKLSPPEAGATSWVVTELISFTGTNGANPGANPAGSLVADAAGNLYGTTVAGGVSVDGTVFELSPPAAGGSSWTETVLTAFTGKNGANPYGSLVADRAGRLFGTTWQGGAFGSGTVFKLSPPAAGTTVWKTTVLTSFTEATGSYPRGSLIADAAGNLYGTTSSGGAPGYGYGTVFKLSAPAAGTTAWTKTVLTAFNGTDGASPTGSLIADGVGNLYGTTYAGGTSNDGTVFELSPPSAGATAWTETVLTSFNKTNGSSPCGSLLLDVAGNLFGTTAYGGLMKPHRQYGFGTVFELSPPVSGTAAWAQTVVAEFNRSTDFIPTGSLIADAKGNLYGTTSRGPENRGVAVNYGGVFKVSGARFVIHK